MSKSTYVVSTRVSPVVKRMIGDAIESSMCINESEFFREAIKEKLVRDAPDVVKRNLR